MAATSSSMWWMTPLQAIGALSSAFNSGASGQPTFLTMPMLQLSSVPATSAATQVHFMLARSEAVFPKVNAVGTLSNLLPAIVCFLNRRESRVAEAKWPWLAAGFACNIAVTAWSLLVMAPINEEMRRLGKKVNEDGGEEAEKGLRAAMAEWRVWAVGRAGVMALAAGMGVYTVFLDGVYGA